MKNKKKRTQSKGYRSTKKRSSISSAKREENKQIQTQLNALGYNVGKADGVLGSKSKAAISRFQGENGFPQTGSLTPQQMGLLFSGASTSGTVAGAPMNPQVLPPQQFSNNPNMVQGFAPTRSNNGFPAVGAQTSGQQNAQSSAFPAIGGAKAAQPAQPGNAFPAVSGAQARPVAGFPSIGAKAASPATGFPAVGQPGAPVKANAGNKPAGFPVFGQKAAIAAPLVGAAVGLTAIDPASKGITQANTNLTFANGQPSLLDIKLGQAYAEAEEKLVANNFQDCSPEGEMIRCRLVSEGVVQTMRLARGLSEENQPVYYLDRLTEISLNVGPDIIKQRLQQAFPELIAAPNHVISSNVDCAAQMSDMTNVETFGQQIDAMRKGPSESDERFEKMLNMCSHFYKVDLTSENGKHAIRVMMFDAAYLKNEIGQKKRETLEKVNNALKF